MTRTNHIMWTMGTDFRYQYANSWFRQMDKFIHYVNKVNLRPSGSVWKKTCMHPMLVVV